jgi:hypothetical protein
MMSICCRQLYRTKTNRVYKVDVKVLKIALALNAALFLIIPSAKIIIRCKLLFVLFVKSFHQAE